MSQFYVIGDQAWEKKLMETTIRVKRIFIHFFRGHTRLNSVYIYTKWSKS